MMCHSSISCKHCVTLINLSNLIRGWDPEQPWQRSQWKHILEVAFSVQGNKTCSMTFFQAPISISLEVELLKYFETSA